MLSVWALGACAEGGEAGLVFQHGQAWPRTSLLPPSSGPRLVVTNSGDDTLSFIDLDSFVEIARIPVGRNPAEPEGPHHLAASPDGRTLFVGISNTVPVNASGPHGSHGTGSANGYLLVLDALTGRQQSWIRVYRSPGDIRLEPGGQRIWQSHYDLVTIGEILKEMSDDPAMDAAGEAAYFKRMDSKVVVTDADTLERVKEFTICPAGHGIAFDPRRGAAYVSCGFSDEIAIIDTATFEVRRVPVDEDPGMPPTPRFEPYAVAVAPSGEVWISNTSRIHPGLRVIDPELGAEVEAKRISTEGLPLFGAFTEDGSRFFVVTQRPDWLLAVNPQTATVEAAIDLEPRGCLNAHSANLSPDGASLWLVCEGDHLVRPGSLERLDVATLSFTGHVELGLFPDDVVVLPEVRP